jgi:hypothetical protein
LSAGGFEGLEKIEAGMFRLVFSITAAFDFLYNCCATTFARASAFLSAL